MSEAFCYARALTGEITINSTPTSYDKCFYNCDMTKITIIGNCGNKDALIETAS